MKVLLINPPFLSAGPRRAPPLGLAYIASVLKANGYYNISLIDCMVHKPLNMRQLSECLNQVFDVVGISVCKETFYMAIQISKIVKERVPNCTVIFGGIHATVTHTPILSHYDTVDVVVRGEGEFTFLDCIKRIDSGDSLENVAGISYRKKDEIVTNPPRQLIDDLDCLPFPDRDLLPPLSAYKSLPPLKSKFKRSATILSSRGCLYNCSFCCVNLIYEICGGKKWRPRAPIHIVNEIEHLIDQYRADHIYFIDDNFLGDEKRVIDIMQELKERSIHIPFSFAARTDQIVKCADIIAYLKDCGCQNIEVGLESGSQSILNRLNKGTTVETNSKAIQILRENSIHFRPDYILWSSDLRFSELKENFNFLQKNGILYPSVLFHKINLYPGTALYEQMKRTNKLRGGLHNAYYKFEDRKVAKVYRYFNKFREKYFSILVKMWTELQKLEEYINLALDTENIVKQVKKYCSFEIFCIKWFPFRMLRALLDSDLVSKSFETERKYLVKYIMQKQREIKKVRELLIGIRRGMTNSEGMCAAQDLRSITNQMARQVDGKEIAYETKREVRKGKKGY